MHALVMCTYVCIFDYPIIKKNSYYKKERLVRLRAWHNEQDDHCLNSLCNNKWVVVVSNT